MNSTIFEQRLKNYSPQTIEEEEHALKEMLQEIVLYGLSTAGFFKEGIFHGGTALRIIHGLPRFSEDLDFLLLKSNPKFAWQRYLDALLKNCEIFGVHSEVIDKSEVGKTVQKMFLKDNSIGKILSLSFHHHAHRKLNIKLEIDTNPPEGSQTEIKFLDFPLDFSLLLQDLSSNFAGKCHAVLCREYTKGRDWYDFGWYIQQKIKPNFDLLANALHQQGPWKNKKINITPEWFLDALSEKISSIDWKKTANDVSPFLKTPEKNTLALWNKDFFIHKLNQLKTIIG